MSTLFSQTLRKTNARIDVDSHDLLLRAGFIRQLAAGVFSYLPLATRSIRKIESILREEMEGIGGQEIIMPVVHPADIWQETGRWYHVGPEMSRFVDRNSRDMVLAMTHEEVVADLVRREVQSYRDLPRLVYQIQTKWRDDPRPRAGLIRVREFTMKDSYSLDTDTAGLDQQYQAHYEAYFRMFHRCGIPVTAVGADVGMMGGTMAHEYMYLTAIGEDTLVFCDSCDYTANRQIARFAKPAAPQEDLREMRTVETPDTTTIEQLSSFLHIPEERTGKAVFMIASIADGEEEREQFIFAVIRGDMDINETKLANAVKASSLRPAQEDEIRAVGAEPGYGSPVGTQGALIVVDDSIPDSPNLTMGANQAGYHTMNVNYGRDYTASVVADIAAAADGNRCPACDGTLYTRRGVEVGNIFKLGTRYSDALGCTFLDQEGVARPVVMGSYGIGVGRLLACIAEEWHDENGLIWPVSVAPYHVYIVRLTDKHDQVNDLVNQLTTAGIQVLDDDRDERAGVKFNDADLLGIPIRITVGERSLKQGGVELKVRATGESGVVPFDECVASVRSHLENLHELVAQRTGKRP
jgi:prolyl-tRNA synthetase